MKKAVYAIKDLKVGTYYPPTIGDSDPAMIRSYGDLVNKRDGGIIHEHPEDFVLVRLGEMDMETGIVTCTPDTIRILASGSDLVVKD